MPTLTEPYKRPTPSALYRLHDQGFFIPKWSQTLIDQFLIPDDAFPTKL